MKKGIENSAKKFTLILCMAALLLTGCNEKAAEVMDKRVLVKADNPVKGDLSIVNEFIGVISPEEQVAVVPMTSGEVTAIHADIGDEVKAGDILLQIDDSAAKLQLEAASLQKESAKQNISRTMTSQEISNLSAQSGLLSAQSGLLSAQNGIETVKSQIEGYERQFNDADKSVGRLEGQMSGAKDSIKAVEGQIGGLESQYAKASQFKGLVSGNSIVGYTFVNEEAKVQVEGAGLTAQDVSEDGLASVASGISGLKTQITQLKSSVATAEASADGAKSQRNSIVQGAELAEKNLNTSQQSMENSVQSYGNSVKSYEIQNGKVLQDTLNGLNTAIGSADVSVKSAQMGVDNCTVTAPISGIIELKNISEHGIAQAGSPAFVISNKNSMTVTFSVSEDIKNSLKIGQIIKIDRNGKEFQANINEINQAVDAQTGLFTIKGTVAATGDELANGVTVKIAADTYRVAAAVLIPYDAVYYDSNAAYVYCIKDGKAVKTPVETGLFDDTTLEIVSGITTKDTVITTWAPQLTDGVEVYTNQETDVNEESGGQS